jgi:GNAT superfamily N-acetyltransferase
MVLAPLIRQAVESDIDRIWDIRYANDIVGLTSVPDQGSPPSYLTHLLLHGSLLVATSGDRIVGFAGLIERTGVAYLTDLFVDPECQSARVGRQLLEQILPMELAIRCTLASTDRRAISLYARAGMTPRWPNLLLEVCVDHLREISSSRIEMFPADPDDSTLHRWDHAARGRSISRSWFVLNRDSRSGLATMVKSLVMGLCGSAQRVLGVRIPSPSGPSGPGQRWKRESLFGRPCSGHGHAQRSLRWPCRGHIQPSERSSRQDSASPAWNPTALPCPSSSTRPAISVRGAIYSEPRRFSAGGALASTCRHRPMGSRAVARTIN